MKELNDDWWVVDGESRIANEFWVAPDGSVCRYHMAPEDTYESVCAIVSLHRVIAERLFPIFQMRTTTCIGWVIYWFSLIRIIVGLRVLVVRLRLRSIPCGILGTISMLGVVLAFTARLINFGNVLFNHNKVCDIFKSRLKIVSYINPLYYEKRFWNVFGAAFCMP